MRNSGEKFWKLMSKTIVPLDSALFFLLYAVHYTALRVFWQVRITSINYLNIKKQSVIMHVL